MVNSTMVSMTKYLNRFSRDYRYIRKVLSKEKRILKVSTEKFHKVDDENAARHIFPWTKMMDFSR